MDELLTGMSDYLNRLAGASAEPGGGSAAALTGAMGAALLEMACNLTVGRPKFAAATRELTQTLARAGQLRAELLGLAEADPQAFAAVMAAYRLPKTPNPQQRRQSIQTALIEAARVQVQVARACAAVIQLAEGIVSRVNPTTQGDLAAGVHLANAGAQAAQLNVAINLKLVDDVQLTQPLRAELAEVLIDLAGTRQQILDTIAGQLANSE